MQSKFRKEPVVYTLILSIVTFGVYPVFWYRRNNQVFESNNIKQIAGWAITLLLILILVVLSCQLTGYFAAKARNFGLTYTVKNLLVILQISLFVTYISLAFSFKERFEKYLNMKNNPAKLSDAGTLLLGIWYLQYKINMWRSDQN